MNSLLFPSINQYHPPKEYIISLLESFLVPNLKQTFIDPFVRNAEVFMSFDKVENYLLGDIDFVVINLLEFIQQNYPAFNDNLEFMINHSKQDEDFYINSQKKYLQSMELEKSILFLYLMNNSELNSILLTKNDGFSGIYHKATIDYKNIVKNYHEKLISKEVMLFPSSFSRLLENATLGDIVYCCPPEKSLFSQKMDEKEMRLLFTLSHKAALRGAKIALIVENNEKNHKLSKDCSWYETLEDVKMPHKMTVVYNY